MDTLSDVLRAVRLTGAHFFRVEAEGPWSAAMVSAVDLMPRVLPDSEHLIAYHILTEGEAWAGLTADDQLHMVAGDVVLFPHADPHVISSERTLRRDGDAVTETTPRVPGLAIFGRPGHSDARLVCGFLGCDARPFNPLLAALPRMMHLPKMASGWLEEFPRQVVAESQQARVGGDTMLTRMAELMFIEVLRHHVEHLPQEHTGWLAGLRDPIVGAALARLHARPTAAWTLPALANEVGASRTVLAERFSAVIGLPPMQYLTQWRLQLAANLLESGAVKVATVASEVGYDSEAAFSRAFKRATGRSPTAWRESRR